MADDSSFYGAPSAPGRRPGKLVAAAVVLVLVGIAFALAKPWGQTGQPAASDPTGVAAVSPSAAASSASALPLSTTLPTHHPHPLAVAFTTAQSPRSETWAGLEWQRLAPDDPLGIVRTEVTSGETWTSARSPFPAPSRTRTWTVSQCAGAAVPDWSDGHAGPTESTSASGVVTPGAAYGA